MTTTAAQLAALKANYAKGVLTLKQGGEEVTFASGEEMRRRIRDLETQLAAESSPSQQNGGFSYPAFDKGL